MIAEIICVGTEILMGSIVNTNAQFISKELSLIGADMYYQTVVGDNPNRLKKVIKMASSRSDVVILCGGLGPTQDDLTKEVVADFLDRKLVCSEEWLKKLKNIFKNIFHREMTDNNIKQAFIIENSQIIDNKNGTAPGLIVEDDIATFILLPGPPIEMVAMWKETVKEYLENKSDSRLYSETIKIVGIGESQVETMINDLVSNQTNPTIATYAKTNEVHLRITAKAPTLSDAILCATPMIEDVKRRFNAYIYSCDEDENLEETVVNMLKQRGMTISVAESCTGGMLASKIVDVPGASEVFKQGFVTYSNEAKIKSLGVREETINNEGAVSVKTAFEMVNGARFLSRSDVGISITGIAGPGGETDSKPVGTVFIGVSIGNDTKINEYHLNGNREKVREGAVMRALALLRKLLIMTQVNK